MCSSDLSFIFKLRQVKMKDLVSEAVEGKTRELLKKARKKTPRVIADSDLGDVFGIDMESPVAPKKGKKKETGKKKQPKPKIGKAKALARKAGKKAGPKKSRTLFETVVGIVREGRKGVTVAMIRKKTGFDEIQIRNIIYRARQQGKIKRKKRGVYIPG